MASRRGPSTLALRQTGGGFMATTRGETAPGGSYHLAVNMLPLNPANPASPLQQRQALVPRSVGAATGTVKASGLLQNGSTIEWILTTTGLWVGGVNVVTAANFATAGVSIALSATDPIYWRVFNNKVVFNLDLTNVNPLSTIEPFTWNGNSGAGSLVKLINAGLCYGRPTVRSAKLFFIRFTERDSIVWSEENDETTGYDAGGFSNIWVLAQTGTAPLYAIQGTNDGLYYFRAHAVGVIRGEVNSDFVTASTHDAVSQTIGTTTPNGVEFANGAVWFTDQNGAPSVLPAGGYPRTILTEDAVTSAGEMRDPLGIVTLGIDRSFPLTGAVPVSVPAQPWAPYEMVWFAFPSSRTGGIAILVCHAISAQSIGWILPGGDCGAVVTVTQDATSGQVTPALAGLKVSTFTGAYGADTNTAGTEVATECVLVGAPLGATTLTRLRYTDLALIAGANAGTTVAVNLATSDDPGASRPPLIASIGNAPDGRTVVRFMRTGRWARPVFRLALNKAAQDVQLCLDGWSLLATPMDRGVTAA